MRALLLTAVASFLLLPTSGRPATCTFDLAGFHLWALTAEGLEADTYVLEVDCTGAARFEVLRKAPLHSIKRQLRYSPAQMQALLRAVNAAQFSTLPDGIPVEDPPGPDEAIAAMRMTQESKEHRVMYAYLRKGSKALRARFLSVWN
jgi:hypothetical protein